MIEGVAQQVGDTPYVAHERAEATEGERRLPGGRVAEADEAARGRAPGATMPGGDVAKDGLQMTHARLKWTVSGQESEILLE